MGLENLQVAIHHDRDTRTLIYVDHWPNRQVLTDHAVSRIGKIVTNVFKDVFCNLILSLIGGDAWRG